MERKCLNCDKLFNGKKNQKFCCRSCATTYRNKQNKNSDIELECRYCHNKFKVKYKERSRKYCSHACYVNSRKGVHIIFTEEHKQNISKAKKGIKTGSKLTQLNKEWWEQHGLSEKESIAKVSKIQKSRSRKANEKRRGKTFDQIYVNANEIKAKISNTLKMKYIEKSDYEKKLLKIKNSNEVKKFWNNNSEHVISLKNKFRNNRTLYNKTIQREYLLNLSDERKKEIADKKRKTFNLKTDAEKEVITKKRILNSQKSIIKNTWGKKIYLENGIGIIVNSSFEEKFIRECEKQNIKIKRGPIIRYLWNDKTKLYFVDFEISKDNVKYLIELKGKHKWYYEELNNGKLKAKIQAARAYLNIVKEYKDYIFILDNVKRYKNILENL